MGADVVLLIAAALSPTRQKPARQAKDQGSEVLPAHNREELDCANEFVDLLREQPKFENV